MRKGISQCCIVQNIQKGIRSPKETERNCGQVKHNSNPNRLFYDNTETKNQHINTSSHGFRKFDFRMKE